MFPIMKPFSPPRGAFDSEMAHFPLDNPVRLCSYFSRLRKAPPVSSEIRRVSKAGERRRPPRQVRGPWGQGKDGRQRQRGGEVRGDAKAPIGRLSPRIAGTRDLPKPSTLHPAAPATAHRARAGLTQQSNGGAADRLRHPPPTLQTTQSALRHITQGGGEAPVSACPSSHVNATGTRARTCLPTRER
jgi:hypothetical protein